MVGTVSERLPWLSICAAAQGPAARWNPGTHWKPPPAAGISSSSSSPGPVQRQALFSCQDTQAIPVKNGRPTLEAQVQARRQVRCPQIPVHKARVPAAGGASRGLHVEHVERRPELIGAPEISEGAVHPWACAIVPLALRLVALDLTVR